MWWRCVAAAGVLTICTLIRAHGHTQVQPKDLLCVLLLSGLQKEDLDVAILKKLQKHNVNIDNIDSEALRNECLQISEKKWGEFRRNGNNESKTTINMPIKITVDDIAPKKEKVDLKPIEEKTDTIANVTQLLTLLSKFTKDIKFMQTTVPTTTSTTTVKPINVNNYESPLSLISKLLEKYITITKMITTTPAPTTQATTTVDIKSMMEEIKNILLSNKQQELSRTTKEIKIVTEAPKIVDEKIDLFDIFNNFLNSFKHKIQERPVADTQKSYTFGNVLENQKNIPQYLVQDIAKNIKEIVLKELRSEITSKATAYEETQTTTVKTDIMKDTQALSQFMELFRQFKNVKVDVPVINNTKTIISNPAGVYVYPKVIHSSMDVYKPNPLTVMPSAGAISYVNPVIQQMPIPMDHQNVFPQVPVYKPNPVNKITQLNIYNRDQQYQHPIMLQTNHDEIPPLSVPMDPPVKLLYQNIVVTTAKPIRHHQNQKLNKDYLYYGYRENINSDIKQKINHLMRAYPPHELLKEYVMNTEKTPTRKDYYNNMKPNSRPPIMHDKYKYERARMPSAYRDYMDNVHYKPKYPDERKQTKIDTTKFHEKLEKVDDYIVQQRDRKPRVAARKLKPLQDEKKYDDGHFRNFLKTQQKVNDMLEKILATKTGTNRKPTSVETT